MSRLALVNVLLRDPAALVIVKVTVVLGFASAAAVAARGFSAARRHMLWLSALLSCIWLVLSSPVLPAIVIHAPMLAKQVVLNATRSTAAAQPSSGNASAANVSRASQRSPMIETARRSSVRSMPLPSHPLIALWIIGCVTLLVRYAIGFVGAARLARRASIVTDDETARELARVTAALGAKREVRLGYSTEVQSPVTFDVATPYVLLPTEARSWSHERRRAVLLHEAAHVSRGDCLSQAIGRVACGLFWFHPLVWRAFAQLRDEAERAADDTVLCSGISAVEYATHLLELARRATGKRANLVAVGIVSTNDLERRFIAMFDAKRSRATVTLRARAVSTCFALTMVCPLASLRVAAPVQPMNALLPRIVHPSVSPPQPVSAATAATHERDSLRVSLKPDVHAAIVGERASKLSQSSIAIVDHPASRLGSHPDFSGKWRQDTVGASTVDFRVRDSTTITQSATAISLESRAQMLDGLMHGGLLTLTFDGAESTGITHVGDEVLNVRSSAVWLGDTLVIKTYALVGYPRAGTHDLLTYERMTLSPDGNTMSVTNLSFVDAKYRWDGPLTFVLRRIAP